MGELDVAGRYFDGWNRHDPAGIAALFHPDGTYADPNVPEGVPPPGLAQYAGALFEGFPDLRFELVHHAPAGDGKVVAQWRMVGTNTGSMRGNPPTGRAVDLPGADVVTVEGDRVRRVQGYFDRQTLLEQLGLTVLAMPRQAGPFTFGGAVAVGSASKATPGAFSLTCVVTGDDDDEIDEVGRYSQELAAALPGMDGFLGWLGATVGRRMYTTTAWERPEQIGQLLAHDVHRAAVHAMREQGLGIGGMTSVWRPQHVQLHVRCAACGALADALAQRACGCGEALPEPVPAW